MNEKLNSWQERIAEIDWEKLGITIQALLGLRQLTWYAEWLAIENIKRMLKENNIEEVIELGRAPLPTKHGDFTYVVFGDLTTGGHHEALVFGNLNERSLGDGENILVRIHSACRTNEAFEAINCECRPELIEALEKIKNEGRGIVLYLEQEGRGTGIFGKLHQLGNMFSWENNEIVQQTDSEGKRIDTDTAYKMAGFPSEIRDFTIAGLILKNLGVRSIRLLTNNPNKIKMIEETGIKVIRESIHITPENPIIASDLESKAKNLGHFIPPEYYNFNNGIS